MKIINRKSSVFLDVIQDIKYGDLTPEDGAKHVLRAVHKVFDNQTRPFIRVGARRVR